MQCDFFLMYNDYAGMELEDQENHISSLGNEDFLIFLKCDDKDEEIMARKQRLVDHHPIIINLENNLHVSGLNSLPEGISYTLHELLCDKGLVALQFVEEKHREGILVFITLQH
jgi:hypothetical protein